jgi:hypothetical protein
MSAFYRMISENDPRWATAYADERFDECELWDSVESLGDPSEWSELKLTASDGDLSDMLPCDVIGRICSARLVRVLDPFADAVWWLPVSVAKDGVQYNYSFMHFPNVPDVLDVARTTYLAGKVARPHLSLEKTRNMPLVCLRPLTPSVVVRSDVRDTIEQSECVGISFEELPCS